MKIDARLSVTLDCGMDIPDSVERQAIAKRAGLNSAYLYQCVTRRRDMDARKAAELERTTAGRLRRWHLRRDWHIVWPELVGAEGAPPVPADQLETRDAA